MIKATSPCDRHTLSLLYMASTALPNLPLTLFHKPADNVLYREVQADTTGKKYAYSVFILSVFDGIYQVTGIMQGVVTCRQSAGKNCDKFRWLIVNVV